jgi:hypothetical protein
LPFKCNLQRYIGVAAGRADAAPGVGGFPEGEGEAAAEAGRAGEEAQGAARGGGEEEEGDDMMMMMTLNKINKLNGYDTWNKRGEGRNLFYRVS